jgi:putative ABC transport system permease protein
MRAEFASTGNSLRLRTALGAVFALAGVGALVAGALATSGGGAATLVGLGALAMIIGVLLGAPALARPVVAGIGLVVASPFGAVGQLARTNAVRNPRRTAATAFALTLGLMLVAAIAVFGSSAKRSIDALVDNGVSADYILTGPNSIGVPFGVRAAAAAVPGVATATALEPVAVTIDGTRYTGTGVDGSLTEVGTVDVLSGTLELSGHHLAVADDQASKNGWRLGSTVVMVSGDGAQIRTDVTAIYRHSSLLGPWLASNRLYTEVTPTNRRADMVVLVKAAPGTDVAGLRTRLVSATDPFLVVTVQDRTQFKGSQASQINGLLAVLYGLLALAIVIAVLGIINTLALSVVERRREIGMLRAVGMLRAQLRRTIYLESTLIALFGAMLGVGLGLLFGTLFVRTLRDQGLGHIAIPVTQAVAMLVLSAVVGVLAALWPAARAARTRPLEAIADL